MRNSPALIDIAVLDSISRRELPISSWKERRWEPSHRHLTGSHPGICLWHIMRNDPTDILAPWPPRLPWVCRQLSSLKLIRPTRSNGQP